MSNQKELINKRFHKIDGLIRKRIFESSKVGRALDSDDITCEVFDLCKIENHAEDAIHEAEESLSHLFPLEADKYIRMRKEFLKRFTRKVTK